MGNAMHFLPSPVTETVYNDGIMDISPKLSCVYGAASMQGWRKKQEDRFTCLPKFCKNVSFFAVYDGHGGSEIAEYLQENLHSEIGNYLECDADIELATYFAFLSSDLTLKHPQTISQLNLKLDIKNQEVSLEKKKKLVCHRMLLEELNMRKKDSRGTALQSDSDACIEGMHVSVQTGGADSSASTSAVSGSRTNEAVGTVSNSAADSTVSSSAAAGSASNGRADGFASISAAKGSISTSAAGSSASAGMEDDTVSSSATEISVSSGVADGITTAAVVDGLETTAAAQESASTVNAPDSVSSSTVQDSGSKGVSEDPGALNLAQDTVSADQSDNRNYVYSAETSSSAISSVGIGVAGPSQVCESSTEEDTEIDDDSCDENMEEAVSGIGGEDIEKPLDYLLNEELESSDPEDEDFSYDDEETESEGSDDENNELSIKKMTAEEFANMQPGDYSGSTATVALLDEKTIYVANVGDSKCILSRKGLAIDMSVDHKPTDTEEQERIVRNGGVVRMGRINDSVDMSRAFGDFRLKGKSEVPLEQCVTAEPSIKSIPITKDDEFLVIASDGIWNSMTSQEVVDYINMRFKQEDCDLRDLCYELFQLILAPDLDNDGTGCDNMSCIIIKLASKDSRLYAPPSGSHSSGYID